MRDVRVACAHQGWEVGMAHSLTLRRRKVAGTTIVLVVALLASVPAASLSAGAVPGSGLGGGVSVPALHWAPCGAPFECATASVPLDYDHANGAKISLSLIRLPASDPKHRIGSLFTNPGGPGGSGIDLVRGAAQSVYSDAVRARFDIVGFDPRGILTSTPLQCFKTFGDALATLAPFGFPVTRAEEGAQSLYDLALANACRARGGAILNHMATADVARDLDLLRRAVGDTKLSFVGYSYGSYIGQTYANMFPGHVRALVIDGVIDPIAWSTGRGDEAKTLPYATRLHSDQGAMATLDQFFVLCKKGGAACAFSAGDPQRRFRTVARQLRRNPIPLPGGASFTYADLINQTLGALYFPDTWPGLADLLEVLDARPSSPAAATAIALNRKHLQAAYDTYPNFVESSPGVACSDSDNPTRFSAWQRAARAADRKFGYFGRPWTWFSSSCLPWPGRDADRFTGPWDHYTANPVLVIGNRFDPATRYQSAVTASRLLPNSRLLTVDGWGHTTLFAGSACSDAAVSRYLLRREVPKVGTVCPVDHVPFTPRASASASAGTASAGAPVAPLVPPLLQRTGH
jgi:pimeloyl-ACP methyl ester carboxylesterase